MADVSVRVADDVATVTLDRAEARNRLSVALMEGLSEACETLAGRDDVRVVVLQSAGRDFSVGADLTDPAMQAIAAGAAAAQAAAATRARELAGTVPPIQGSMIKETVNALANVHTPLRHMDRDQSLLAQSSEDFREAIGAFLEKRPATVPESLSARPAGGPTRRTVVQPG